MPFYVCRNCSFGDDLPYRFCPRCHGALLVPIGSVGFARERTQRPPPGAYRDPAAIDQWLQGVQTGTQAVVMVHHHQLTFGFDLMHGGIGDEG